MENLNGSLTVSPPLRILHLEDNPADALLVRDQLASEAVAAEVRHVSGRADFLQALGEGHWDLILADYRLPDYNGLEALKVVRQQHSNLPFILISATLGDAAAVESLKAGATDYILKQQRERLPVAVQRAVMEARERARREAAEEDLRRSEQQYRLLFQGNPHPMRVFDLESLAILEVNEAAAQHYGYIREEFLRMTLTDLRVSEPQREANLPMDLKAQGLVWRHRRKCGDEMDMELIWSPLTFHGKMAALALATDVTARRREIQQNAVFARLSHNLSAVTTASEAARFISAAAEALFHWDDFALDLYAADRHEVVGLLKLTTREGQRVEVPVPRVPQAANALVRRVVLRGAELVATATAGDPTDTTMLAPVRNGDRVIGVLLIQRRLPHSYGPRDVQNLQTLAEQCGGGLQRVQVEEALRNSETLFRSVWENSVDGMRLTDENGLVVAANQAFCRLVGLAPNQLEGQPFTVAYSAKQDPDEMLRRHCHRFRQGIIREKQEHHRILHDHRAVILEITDSYVESGGKPHLLLSLFRDATSHRRLEEQLRQSQKLEAIGQLAGGIAHDFNNILTIILGHATLLTMAKLDAKSLVSAQQIKQASERAAGLTRQLLAFGRKQIYNPRPLDLNRVVGKLTDLLARLLGEDIALQINFSSQPVVISADVSMMEQILLNLSVNSRDAMPRGGQLTIRMSPCHVDEAHTSRVAEARVGRFIRLSHSDTGEGIPPENLARIFEPFFTTKELGKGTGLGLATVFGIVKQHEGWVEVESELGKGTTFHIYFAASNEAAMDPEHSDTQFHARKGTETILVVEDERDLREIVTRTLNLNGYRVFQAVDGRDALQIWTEHQHQIDLLFTDIVMPGGLNGRELAERFLADKPGLKVIFSSGYGADTLGKNFKLDPKLNFLQKPYLPQTLSRVIRHCLDEESLT